MSKIATAAFQGSPTDNYQITDIYNKSGTDLLGGIVNGTQTVLDNAFTSIRKSGFNLSSLAKLVDISGGSVSLSSAEAEKRLGSMLGVNINSLQNLPDAVKSGAVSKLTALAGINTNALTQVTGQVINATDGVNAYEVQGILTGLKKVLGSDLITDIIDTTAQVSFLTSLLNYSVKWGLTDTVDIIMSKLSDSKVASTSLSGSFTAAIYNGDLDMIQTIISQLGPQRLLATYPNATSLILTAYSFRDGTTVADYPRYYQQLIAILHTLDNLWDVTNRNGSLVRNLTPFTTVSTDAKTLLSYGDGTDAPYWDAILVAPNYPNTDAIALVKTFYPQIAL